MVALPRSKKHLLELLRQPSIFLVVGGLNTAVGLLAYPFLYWVVGGTKNAYIGILFISQIGCILFSFLSNKWLVFKTKGNYLKEFGKFGFFHGVIFLVNLLALPFMVENFSLSPPIAQVFFSIFVILTSYTWYKFVAFK